MHDFLSVNLEEEFWLIPSGIQVNVKIVCIISHSEATGTTPVEEETEINKKGFFAGSPQPQSGPRSAGVAEMPRLLFFPEVDLISTFLLCFPERGQKNNFIPPAMWH